MTEERRTTYFRTREDARAWLDIYRPEGSVLTQFVTVMEETGPQWGLEDGPPSYGRWFIEWRQPSGRVLTLTDGGPWTAPMFTPESR